MPPKKPDAEGAASAAVGNPYNLSDDEMRFLVDCLLHPVGGGTISIDTKAVAEARGQKNAGSIYNRITAMKKKYNIPITGSMGNGGSGRKTTAAADPTGPVTPSKNRVTKSRAKASAKKVKATKEEGDSAEEDASLKVEFDGEEAEDNMNEDA